MKEGSDGHGADTWRRVEARAQEGRRKLGEGVLEAVEAHGKVNLVEG
jgi:hypothetical protein